MSRPGRQDGAVHVIATTPEDTRNALAAAIPLAQGLGARLVLVVAQIVPRSAVPDAPTGELEFTAERYRNMVHALGGEAHIDVHACRSFGDVLERVPFGATVVLGGPAGPQHPVVFHRVGVARS